MLARRDFSDDDHFFASVHDDPYGQTLTHYMPWEVDSRPQDIDALQ